MNYDVIIIGGGPSGLMASIAAAQYGARTLLIDKGDKLGRKLGISGGGRCNVTNAKEIDELIRNIPGNGRFLHSALANFNNRDIIAFFENIGIRLKEEDRGRMFPVSDKAKTVVDALIRKAKSAGVEMLVNKPVAGLLLGEGEVQGVRLRSGERISSTAVIIATGGKSVPHTGSTGDGYPWAVQAGHTITELYPTEVPLVSRDAFIQSKELQGLSLRDVSLSVWNPKGKKVIEHDGDLIFTHFGLSGPIALRCSQFVVKILKQFEVNSVKATIDLFPQKPADELATESLNLAKNEPKRAVKNVLKALLPERMIPIILKKSGLSGETTFDNIPKQPWSDMAALLKGFPVNISGTLSIEEAFVTGGGVNLKEVQPGTMQSKITRGLFFCGEILDIHGYTGGYNITAAFTTGYTAGKSAAEMLHDKAR
ncbi:NAD(P)/FAD-dependent oxidoreductase [Paenibacillus sp. sptzw28]|uniref:NAD(P)/FAD-dependent oxidoreductase n=1 Tax=Paenibacillus sp. sptzw28 TaxID=715179 RepID=UPI001C6E2B6F|nr:NAD(P)/FAD-dependent oxidoreductase [Paenibacillus sp. sptzw28]QYR22697.1 NAD(P)/FAD-dependent oxidoreductase [Paenibacillus sp. sptzw28]